MRALLRGRARAPFAVLVVLLLTLAPGATETPAAVDPPIDRDGLARGRYATMQALVEVTVLDKDLLYAHIRFGQDTADVLESLAKDRELDEDLEDRIARSAYRAPQAYLRIHFLRDLDFDTFIEAALDNLRRAREGRMISERNYQRVARDLRRRFGFLKDRGIVEGDRFLYRAHPRSLRTVFVDSRGRKRFDQTEEGTDPRLAALAAYFAPDSELRERFVASLFDDDD